LACNRDLGSGRLTQGFQIDCNSARVDHWREFKMHTEFLTRGMTDVPRKTAALADFLPG
jgi:hypothetical protein